jgi:hypothetical protein
MVGWRASKESTKSYIGREDIVRDPYQDRVWVVSHVIIVWLEEVCLEKGMLETTGEALDDEVAIETAEECRTRVSHVPHHFQRGLAARAEARLILIFIKFPDLLS